MLGTLNLYLNCEASYIWHEASLVSAKVQGHGVHHAQNICTWIHAFLNHGKLPLHHYRRFHPTILDDEDFTHEISLYLLKISKHTSIQAQDIVDWVQLPDVQKRLGGTGLKTSISLQSAQCWLHRLNWRYGQKRNGMYIDGHECKDVAYRKAFVTRWAEYEKHMVHFDNNGNEQSITQGFDIEQCSQ